MDAKTIRKMIDDQNVSDDDFFEALKKYLTGDNRTTLEVDKLREEIIKKRPNAHNMVAAYVVELFEHCCGPNAKKH